MLRVSAFSSTSVGRLPVIDEPLQEIRPLPGVLINPNSQKDFAHLGRTSFFTVRDFL